MGVAIDITAAERKTVLELIDRHLPSTPAWVYGSRTKWTSRPQSDLDLVVFATPKQHRRVGDLREAFEESNLPFRVDLFVWDDVPDSFRKRIEAEHVALVGDGKRIGSPAMALETVYGDFPFDFLEETLADLCHDVGIQTGPFGSQLHQEDYVPIGTPIITVEHLGDNRILHQNLPCVSDDDAQRLSRYTLREGDVVFSRVGSVDRRALVRQAENGWLFSGRCLRVRPNPSKLDSGYLSYFFGLPAFQAYIRSVAVGATMPSLNTQILSAVTVPHPPPAEQRAIAHILGTLDDKIELNRRMNVTLEAMARALFRSWFVDFDPVRAKMEGRDTGLPKEIADLFPDRLVDSELGEIPEGWPLVPLSELIEVNPSRSLRRGEIAPYLDMANMPTLGHAPDSVVQRPFNSGMRFANGDALVARITPCLENGKTAYVDFLRDGETGWGSTEYIVMKPRPPLPGEFAYLLARSARFREFAIQNMSGTSGRQRVPAAALSGFTIPSPPAPVGTAFGLVVRSFLRRARAAVDECRVLANCRDALIPKLVSGEVRVTGPEPASGRDDHPVPVGTHGA